MILASGKALDVESCFSQLTLDIIGLAVFNYDYNALTTDSPVIQAVYTALKETEQRATDLLPIWKARQLGSLRRRSFTAKLRSRFIPSHLMYLTALPLQAPLKDFNQICGDLS